MEMRNRAGLICMKKGILYNEMVGRGIQLCCMDGYKTGDQDNFFPKSPNSLSIKRFCILYDNIKSKSIGLKISTQNLKFMILSLTWAG